MLAAETFNVRTKGNTDIIDVTENVASALKRSTIRSGIAAVFTAGSTAGITTIEYEDGAVSDLKEAIERIVPKNIHYNHDARWGDGNGFAHVRASLLSSSFTVPFKDKRLILGTWQQIILIDFDNRPRSREVLVQIIGE